MNISTPKNKPWGDLPALLVCVGLALAFRLPGLNVFLTADEPRSWFGRSIIFLDSLARGNLANTGPGGVAPYIENVSLSPAPGVTTMWSGALGLLLEYLRRGMPGPLTHFLQTVPFDPLDPAMLFWLRLPGVLVAAAAVGLSFWWSRPLLGRWGALLAAALIALDPFYLALSRVLGHDALVSTFMWLSLLAFLRAVRSRVNGSGGLQTPPARRWVADSPFLVLSGLFGGLAFLSKYPALFIGAFIALSMLAVYLPAARAAPRLKGAWIFTALKLWLGDIAIWSAAAGVVFVLLWPAMWVNPAGPVTAIISDALRASGSAHQKGSFFLGRPVPDPGLLFYPVIAVLRTTPVVFFGFLLALWLLARRRLVVDSPAAGLRHTAPLILLAYIVLYTLLVTYGGKKQDRYLLPAFPAIAMLAAAGYMQLAGIGARLSKSAAAKIFSSPFWLIPAMLVLIQIVLVWPHYPYYFTYYNPFAGGGRAATKLVQVGWGEGLDKAAAYLNSLPEAGSARVTSWYSTTFEPYFKGQAIYKIEDDKISRSAKPGLAADYVVFYVNQLQRRLPSDGALQYFLSAGPVYTVTLHGIDYAWIYPSVGLDYVFPDDTRLVGQAELLGYTLTDEAGRPVSSAFPESVVLISLYWAWQGKVEDEPVQISLVDEQGNTRGWGNPIKTVAPLPYAEWQEGMVVRDEFALVIFADTPPGEYRLSVWIDRPSTGETVGVFPTESTTLRVVPRGE